MDTVKNTRQLKWVADFVDGDSRTITVDNPKATVTAADIGDIETKAAGVLIGDKDGAPFKKISAAKIVEQTTVYLDLTTA